MKIKLSKVKENPDGSAIYTFDYCEEFENLVAETKGDASDKNMEAFIIEALEAAAEERDIEKQREYLDSID